MFKIWLCSAPPEWGLLNKKLKIFLPLAGTICHESGSYPVRRDDLITAIEAHDFNFNKRSTVLEHLRRSPEIVELPRSCCILKSSAPFSG